MVYQAIAMFLSIFSLRNFFSIFARLLSSMLELRGVSYQTSNCLRILSCESYWILMLKVIF
ncbi:hypothetical protein A3K87_23930 [Variovorax paradoxus]|uniref:Uncharacterized protein n=1 Tax=Variovorax paradoxus TaxID=34073 RepID=A0AA91DJZ0_VARPD|nr:hypothetical protein A3K87_23930 [Variovorax paradoxus]